MTPSSKVVKLKGKKSPYSQSKSYWSTRLGLTPSMNPRARILFNKQKGICVWCKHRFYWDDILEVDHIISKHAGGSNKMDNLQVLHRHCHDYSYSSKTALDLSKQRKRDAEKPIM